MIHDVVRTSSNAPTEQGDTFLAVFRFSKVPWYTLELNYKKMPGLILLTTPSPHKTKTHTRAPSASSPAYFRVTATPTSAIEQPCL